MARIVMADDAIAFDGEAPGGRDDAVAAFVGLAEALAARGHAVAAFTKGKRSFSAQGVGWAPLASGLPHESDLYVAHRNPRLLRLAPRARAKAIWLRDPGRLLFRWGRLTSLARHRPTLAFLGVYHAASYPGWAPGGGRAVLPPATAPEFRQEAPARRPPPPFAIWNARSARALDWGLELWRERIRQTVPAARLYVLADEASLGRASAATRALAKARALHGDGVVLRPPVVGAALVEELRQSRVFLHCGDPDDMFCMEAAEAQAMGVPAVVCDVSCLRERVVDGETGYVVPEHDATGFAAAAARLLTEDALWRSHHDAALGYNRARSWDDVAADFEDLRK